MVSGIYAINSKCEAQYTGKTTGIYNECFNEQIVDTAGSSVKEHLSTCHVCLDKTDFKMQFLESVWKRGKYSLSERKYLWDKRMKGSINIQKTLRK